MNCQRRHLGGRILSLKKVSGAVLQSRAVSRISKGSLRRMTEWETIIGLEVHVELATASKMFSACPVVDSTSAAPNSAVDELSLGLPGTLPVINQKALVYATRVALALGCEIPPYNEFARKNYFYPDLPKGYQISQYEHPLAIRGRVDIETEAGARSIRIRRAHLEEDTGKLTHPDDGSSLVDYNRAGVPLLEIVSEPDMRSAAEAEAYARKLRAILRYLGVNSGDMSKGVLRLEANVSARPRGETTLRQRTEIKNLNSLRNLHRAIEAEAERQIVLWESGDAVRSATIGWDEQRQRLIIQRHKEEADEYRYFPEPDLPRVQMPREWVEEQRAALLELPDAKRERFLEQYQLSAYDAEVLVAERATANYFEALVAAGAAPKLAANWMMGELFALMNREGMERENFADLPIAAVALAELLALLVGGKINRASALRVLAEMWDSAESASAIVERDGLWLVEDDEALVATVRSVLAAENDLVMRYHAGERKLFGALMGAVMRALAGRGNPSRVRELISTEWEHISEVGE